MKIIAVAALASMIAAPAFAADMAVKAPAPAAVVSADWSGLYADVGVGWQRTNDTWFYNDAIPGLGGPPFSMSSTSASIAGHVGYQQQFNWLVIGGEVGKSAPWNDNWAVSVPSPGPGSLPCLFGTGSTCQVQVGDVTTYGAKLGVVWQNWLVYGVGGGARGNIASRVVSTNGGTDSSSPNSANGWYAGGGADFMAFKSRPFDMIVGVEYEHVDLRTLQQFSSFNGFVSSFDQRTIHPTEDIVWAKLTLKLNPLN